MFSGVIVNMAEKVKFKTVNFNGPKSAAFVAGQGKLNVAAAFQEDFDEGTAKKRLLLICHLRIRTASGQQGKWHPFEKPIHIGEPQA